MIQSDCENTYFNGRESQAPHIDAVQGVDTTGFVFDHNLVLHNSTGVVNYDGSADDVVVTNNVFDTESDATVLCAATNLRVEHNTVKHGDVKNCVNHNKTRPPTRSGATTPNPPRQTSKARARTPSSTTSASAAAAPAAIA